MTKEDRGVTGAVMDALWPVLGGDMLPAELWHEISAAVSEATAKHTEDSISDFLFKCKLNGHELVHIPTILEQLEQLEKRIDEVSSYDYRNLG